MRISLLFILILVLSACSHVSDVDHTTLVEATLEADIPSGHTFFTKELNDSAFSLFQTSNGYGILEFSKQEKDWIYQGSSLYERAATLTPLLSTGQATWQKASKK